jgi:hypothetical protein
MTGTTFYTKEKLQIVLHHNTKAAVLFMERICLSLAHFCKNKLQGISPLGRVRTDS